jgi:hypothetical protein
MQVAYAGDGVLHFAGYILLSYAGAAAFGVALLVCGYIVERRNTEIAKIFRPALLLYSCLLFLFSAVVADTYTTSVIYAPILLMLLVMVHCAHQLARIGEKSLYKTASTFVLLTGALFLTAYIDYLLIEVAGMGYTLLPVPFMVAACLMLGAWLCLEHMERAQGKLHKVFILVASQIIFFVNFVYITIFGSLGHSFFSTGLSDSDMPVFYWSMGLAIVNYALLYLLGKHMFSFMSPFLFASCAVGVLQSLDGLGSNGIPWIMLLLAVCFEVISKLIHRREGFDWLQVGAIFAVSYWFVVDKWYFIAKGFARNVKYAFHI